MRPTASRGPESRSPPRSSTACATAWPSRAKVSRFAAEKERPAPTRVDTAVVVLPQRVVVVEDDLGPLGFSKRFEELGGEIRQRRQLYARPRRSQDDSTGDSDDPGTRESTEAPLQHLPTGRAHHIASFATNLSHAA